MDYNTAFNLNGYVVVKNLISREAADIINTYTLMRTKLDYSEEPNDFVPNTKSVYGDYLTESLMLNLWKKIENITNLKLLPTYTFYRVYKNSDILPKHKDRPSCEISCTLNLGQSHPWKFFANNNGVLLEPGDGVIYKGMEVEHWREKFSGDYHSQVFLHYVNAEGEFKDYFMDKRNDIYGIMG
jgi:hypothetical protein